MRMQSTENRSGERNRQERRLDATDEAYRQIVEREARRVREKTERLRHEREISVENTEQSVSRSKSGRKPREMPG